MRHRACTGVAALALALSLPGVAHGASERLEFYQHADGTAAVHGEPGGPMGPERFEVRRTGVSVGTPMRSMDWGSGLSLPQLLVGDEASYSVNGRHVITHVYDGFPEISVPCAGATTFRAALGPLTLVTWSASESATEPGVYTLPQPLAVGKVIQILGWKMIDGVRVTQGREVQAVDCSPPPAPRAAAPIPAPVPSLQTALANAVKSIKRTSSGFTLTVAFPQPGALALRLSRGGKTLVKVRRAGATSESIPLRMSRAQRGRRLMLSATLAPVRAGQKAQKAKVTLMVRR